MNMGTATELWVLGHRVRPLHTIGDFGLVEIVSLPGVPGPPPHHHADAAEFFYVADGTLDIMIDGDWKSYSSGDSICIEPGVTHTLMNRGDEDVRWITGWSPRGFEQFFEDFGVAAREDGSFESSVSPQVIERVGRDCSNYGMIIDAREGSQP